MKNPVRKEYEKTLKKRDEIRESLKKLEQETPRDTYAITIARDRLAYWEGMTEGLKFALDHLEEA